VGFGGEGGLQKGMNTGGRIHWGPSI